MGGLGDAGSHAVAANPGLPHVVGEPGTIIGGMDDEVYALLTRLIALAPDGDAGVNALVRSTCAAAWSLPPLIAEGEPADDPMLAAFAEQFAVDVSMIGDEQRA